MLTFTYDLEDSRSAATAATMGERFTAVTDRLLGALDDTGTRGTFFVVGELAAEHPGLMRRIADHGHEVALHGWTHVPLRELDVRKLREHVRRGRGVLEDATGEQVEGFRAPIFSLVDTTRWAVDVLGEEGFSYSSSVLPAANPLYGMPDAPRRPFRWPNGLVELPCPVAGRGRVSLPYLGGVYLRYLPLPVVTGLARAAQEDAALWIYCHPYDFDAGEPFHVMPHAGWLTSRILHYRRRSTLTRVTSLLERFGAAAPLRDVARTVSEDPA